MSRPGWRCAKSPQCTALCCTGHAQLLAAAQIPGASRVWRKGARLLPAAFFQRHLLVDVGAADPLRRIEVGPAVLVLELLRGTRLDHLLLRLAGLHELGHAV